MPTNNLIGTEELQAILAQFDSCALECDGMTFVLSAFLDAIGQPHQRMIGSAQTRDGEGVVSPHCWIALMDGLVVDFRLRMWLGQDAAIPHGVFAPAQSTIVYTGQESRARLPPLSVIDMLSEGRYSVAVAQFHRPGCSN